MPGIDRVEIRAVTCPAGTAQSAAVETGLSFPAGEVIGIEIVIADGHAGVTGIALANSHSIVIPASGNVWITSNDEVIKWPYEDQMRNGSWSAFSYNTDPTNPHTWYLRFLIVENRETLIPAQPQPLSSVALQAAVNDATLGAGAEV